MIPLSLYIHVPWCVRKCPYCDFNSHEIKSTLPEQDYINALVRDIEFDLPSVWGRKIQSIFIGGGTPSTLSPEAYDQLLSALRARLSITPDTEITMEVNPGTVDKHKLSEYRKTGINRLSIGVQSFDNDLLNRIGRIHDRKAAFVAAESAHDAGFDNINLDIMFGLPTQTIAQGRSDVENAVALDATHISYYELTIEPNTYFYQYPPTLPEDDRIARIQENGMAILKEHGFDRYEISAYAKKDRQCRHNMNYWQFGDYLGIGAGAHEKITSPEPFRIMRRSRKRLPQEYIESAGSEPCIVSPHTLDDSKLILEFMMNALRLVDGFDSSIFEPRTGIPLEKISQQLQIAGDQSLIDMTSDRLFPTAKGLKYLNNLIELFIP